MHSSGNDEVFTALNTTLAAYYVPKPSKEQSRTARQHKGAHHCRNIGARSVRGCAGGENERMVLLVTWLLDVWHETPVKFQERIVNTERRPQMGHYFRHARGLCEVKPHAGGLHMTNEARRGRA